MSWAAEAASLNSKNWLNESDFKILSKSSFTMVLRSLIDFTIREAGTSEASSSLRSYFESPYLSQASRIKYGLTAEFSLIVFSSKTALLSAAHFVNSVRVSFDLQAFIQAFTKR